MTKSKEQGHWIGLSLHALGARRLQATFSGSGDSGDLDDILYFDAEGDPLPNDSIQSTLEAMKVFNGTSHAPDYHEVLVDLLAERASDFGNYYENEGGSVVIDCEIDSSGLEIVGGSFEPGVWDEDEFDEDEDYGNGEARFEI